MKNTTFRFTRIASAAALGLLITHAQLALAGWSGVMNGTGYGQTSVNVISSTLKEGAVTTPNMQDPSAAMTNATGYVYGAKLPSGSSKATVAKVKGSSGYIWQAETVGSNGDSTDNSELESRVRITAADCASLEMTSSAVIAPAGNSGTISGTITVNAKATAGTALWLRGIEFSGDRSLLPNDDPLTEVNETIEFLKTNVNSSLKWDVLLVGPFDLNTASCSALTIPFTIETDPDHLYFVTDAVAKSLPLVIQCPNDILVTDKEPVTYPDSLLVGGCGNITLSFSGPPTASGSFPANSVFPPGSFPVGTTPVTATATDKDGNTKSCTFNVVVRDTTAPVITASGTPDNGVLGLNPTAAQIEAALGTATATDNGGTVTPTAQTGSVSVNGCSRSQTRTWNATDAAGNAATPVTRTATWTEDKTPPDAPSLPTVTGSCSTPVTLTAPTTTDNCAGTVIGTTTTTFPITAAGNTVVTWTFNDGNGNVSTAQQTVIVSGLEFHGFYSPIGGTGGACGSPLRTANLGNNLPVKFDVECGGSRILSGRPTLSIEKSNATCTSLTPIGGGDFTLVGNEWHFNWATGSGTGVTAGTYKLTATLQDGTQRFVWIKLR